MNSSKSQPWSITLTHLSVSIDFTKKQDDYIILLLKRSVSKPVLSTN
ncbi:hypothetical protein B0I21_107139 [Sphingobacterium paludis]|uniref:Uncharacterized protein n=1 Tax=Sphingobacterium paludis TaxID=1476465 RepID=A0A4R7CVD6_9SPHI|nr:hypothetical protein B0I21_107139 [Sphingobacterium paludis]